MPAIAQLIRTKFDVPRLVPQRASSEWSAVLAQANDFLDLECRLTVLTQPRRTLDSLERRAA